MEKNKAAKGAYFILIGIPDKVALGEILIGNEETAPLMCGERTFTVQNSCAQALRGSTLDMLQHQQGGPCVWSGVLLSRY